MKTVRISSTNGNKNQKSVVRVYVNGVLITQLFVNKHGPLGYLQTLGRSLHHVALCDYLDSAMNEGDCSIEQANYIKSEIFPLINR